MRGPFKDFRSFHNGLEGHRTSIDGREAKLPAPEDHDRHRGWFDRYDPAALGTALVIGVAVYIAAEDWTLSIVVGASLGNIVAYCLRRRAGIPDSSLLGRLRARPGEGAEGRWHDVPRKERWAIIGVTCLLWLGTLLALPTGLISGVTFGVIAFGFLIAMEVRRRVERPTGC